MTITEAAKTVNCSRQTIYNYIKQQKLQAQHDGDSYDIKLEDLMDAFKMSSKTSTEANETSNIDTSKQASNQSSNETSNVDKYIDTLIEQLEEKDKQIQELHQIVALTQKSVNQLTEQNQLLLEDNHHKPTFWQRLKSHFAEA